MDANQERSRIARLEDLAERKRNYDLQAHFTLRAQAGKALAAWREKYPDAARAEADEATRRGAEAAAKSEREFKASFVGRGLD